jgi:hypothetical protein
MAGIYTTCKHCGADILIFHDYEGKCTECGKVTHPGGGYPEARAILSETLGEHEPETCGREYRGNKI